MDDNDRRWAYQLLAAPDDIEREMATLRERHPLPEPGPGSYGAAIGTLIRAAAASGMDEAEIASLPRVAAYLRTQVSPAEVETLYRQATVRCIVARIRVSRRVDADAEGRLTLDQARALAITEVQLAPIGDQMKDDLIETLDVLFQPMYTSEVEG